MSRPAGALSIHDAAEEAPDEPAVMQGARVWTFRTLAERVAESQRSLRTLGLSAGARVAVCARPDFLSIVRVSAILEEGLVPCLLHPRWPSALQTALTEGVGATPVDEAFDTGAEAPLSALTDSSPKGSESRPAVMSGLSGRNPSAEPPPRGARDPEADFAVFWTSGTSAAPKGVRLSRRAFQAAAHASAENLGWRSDDRWLLNLPVAHIGGFSILVRARLARRPVVLPPWSFEASFEARAFQHVLSQEKVTLASVVPTMLHRLVRAGLAAPRSLRALLVGGAHADGPLLEAAHALDWPVLTTYGLTEACSQVSTQAPGTLTPGCQDVGRPLPGVQLRLQGGFIEIRGATLMSGYLPPSEETFLRDGWFRTGDIGRLDAEGRLFVEGRAHDLVISGGENVSPLRVEAALRACPGVSDAVVYGLEDEAWGEVVAASLVADGPRPSQEALVRALSPRLARFERPRRLRWVSGLPLLPNGKVDRRRARADAEGTANAELEDDVN